MSGASDDFGSDDDDEDSDDVNTSKATNKLRKTVANSDKK